jgi:hypothetical protein
MKARDLRHHMAYHEAGHAVVARKHVLHRQRDDSKRSVGGRRRSGGPSARLL